MHPQTQELRARYNPDGSDLRKAQLKMLEILCAVTAICDKHALPYWLWAGTLVGAKVHDGFVPWDDDIDIGMMRRDWIKLLKILPQELPSDMCLQTPWDKGCSSTAIKVRDRKSIVHMNDEYVRFVDASKYEECGVYIDIAPFERGWRWMKKLLDFTYGRFRRRLKRGKPLHSLRYFVEYAISLVGYPVSAVAVARGVCAARRASDFDRLFSLRLHPYSKCCGRPQHLAGVKYLDENETSVIYKKVLSNANRKVIARSRGGAKNSQWRIVFRQEYLPRLQQAA